jgi:hypothetical protein
VATLPLRWALGWVRFNVVLFSAYALFGVLSLFWPAPLERLWLYPLHLAGLALTLAVIYGLARRRRWAPPLVVLFALGMMAHLIIFMLVPISMAIAYVGPSRSFYTLAIRSLSWAGAEAHSMRAVWLFNFAMALVHGANVWFFLRTGTVEMFRRPPPPATSSPGAGNPSLSSPLSSGRPAG